MVGLGKARDLRVAGSPTVGFDLPFSQPARRRSQEVWHDPLGGGLAQDKPFSMHVDDSHSRE